MTKACTKCKEVKGLDEFYTRKAPRQYSSFCKGCYRARVKAYRDANREKARACVKRSTAKSKDKYNATKKRWAQNNKDIVKAIRKRWRQNNSAKVNAKTARYRARKLQAAIEITKEEKKQIEQIYARCERLNKTTNIDWEVDHIAPLQGASVCGLHVPWNLQVVPATENRRKSNKFGGTMGNNDNEKEKGKTLIETIKDTLAAALRDRPEFTDSDKQRYYDVQRKGK